MAWCDKVNDDRYGRIRLLDRVVLEQAGCECYQVVKRKRDRLLPHELLTPSQTARAR